MFPWFGEIVACNEDSSATAAVWKLLLWINCAPNKIVNLIFTFTFG